MIPSREQLKEYLRINSPVTISKIARKFGIRIVTASELVKELGIKKEVVVEQNGKQKLVSLNK